MIRDITKVIPRLLAVLPESEPYLRVSFERLLKRAREDAYRAPEYFWEQGAHILYGRFGENPPDEEWFRRLKAIWTGQEVGEDGDMVLPPRDDRQWLDDSDWTFIAIGIVVLAFAIFFVLGCARDVRACYADHEGDALQAAQREPNSTAWPVYYGELARRCRR